MRWAIHRFKVTVGVECRVDMPGGSVVVGAGYQPARDEFSVWARVPIGDTASLGTVPRTFLVVGTGHEFSTLEGDEVRHVATAVMPDGFHVFHVMELVPR